MIEALPCSGSFTACVVAHFPVVELDNENTISIASIAHQGVRVTDCGIPRRGCICLTMSFSIGQGLKYLYVALVPTLTLN